MRVRRYGSLVGKRAFSLMELIIVIMMLFALVGTVTLLFIVGLKAFDAGYARGDIRQDISQAMQRMIREIRQAKDSTVIVTSTQIDFTADLDSGISGDEVYRYRLVSNELRWSRISPNSTSEVILARNLDLPASSFSEDSNLISIQLQSTQDEQTVILRSNVRPRNL